LKILILGSNYCWSIDQIYKRELIKTDNEVHFIEIQNLFFDYYFKNVLNKISFRLGFSAIYDRINNYVLNQTENQTYDLIWVFKGMELYPSTLQKLRKQSKRLINFNPDNPFIFSGKGSGNSNVTNSINLFDEHFTYDSSIKDRLINEFGVKCTLVPFGFDQEIILDNELSNLEEVNSVCFLGNPDSYRAEILKSVLDQGLPLHVYGFKWDKFLKHPLVKCHEPVYERKFLQIIRSYRVHLNIMRIHNLDSHNMRSIEIPGCGGIMLAPKTKDHVNFFEEGKEAFFYSSGKDLVNKAKSILEMDINNINKIRNSAREKVLAEFSYSKLVKKFIF
jgi:spore maturation protein CgeB